MTNVPPKLLIFQQDLSGDKTKGKDTRKTTSFSFAGFSCEKSPNFQKRKDHLQVMVNPLFFFYLVFGLHLPRPRFDFWIHVFKKKFKWQPKLSVNIVTTSYQIFRKIPSKCNVIQTNLKKTVGLDYTYFVHPLNLALCLISYIFFLDTPPLTSYVKNVLLVRHGLLIRTKIFYFLRVDELNRSLIVFLHSQ